MDKIPSANAHETVEVYRAITRTQFQEVSQRELVANASQIDSFGPKSRWSYVPR